MKVRQNENERAAHTIHCNNLATQAGEQNGDFVEIQVLKCKNCPNPHRQTVTKIGRTAAAFARSRGIWRGPA